MFFANRQRRSMTGLGANVEMRRFTSFNRLLKIVARTSCPYLFQLESRNGSPWYGLFQQAAKRGGQITLSLGRRFQRLPPIERHGEFTLDDFQPLSGFRDRGTVLLIEARLGHRFVQGALFPFEGVDLLGELL